MKFANKLSLVTTIGAIITATIIGISSYFAGRDILRKTTIHDHQTIAQGLMREIDSTMHNALRDLTIVAEDEALYAYLNSAQQNSSLRKIVQKELEERLELTGPWESLMILDTQGNHILATHEHGGHGHIGNYPESNTAFNHAMGGEPYVSDFSNSDHSTNPVIIFAVPIRNDDLKSDIVGVAIGHFKWTTIYKILENVGSNIDTHLLNKRGKVIALAAHNSKTLEHDPELIQDIINGPEPDNAFRQLGLHYQQPVLTISARQRGYKDYKGHGWNVILDVPINLINDPIRQLSHAVGLSVFLSMTLLATLFYLIGRRFIKPLNLLTTTLRNTNNDSLAQRLDINSKDEFGELASSFNYMMEELQSTTISQQHFENIIDTMESSLVVMDMDKRISMVNSATEKLLKFSKNELIGKRVDLLVLDGENGPALGDEFEKLTPDNARLSGFELKLLSKDGESLSVLASVAAMQHKNGEFVSYVFSAMDMSEQKQAQNALIESETQLKAVFNNSLDGIAVANVSNMSFYTANQAFCNMLGYDLSELKTLEIQDIHPAEDLDYVLEQFHRQVAGDIVLATNIPVARKDGSIFYAEVNSSNMTIGDQQYLLGVFRDITERKVAEEALKRSYEHLEHMVQLRTQQLAHSEQNIRNIIETIPDALFVLEIPGYRPTFVSPVIEDLLGFTANDFIQDPDLWRNQLHEQDRSRIADEIEQAIINDINILIQGRMWHKSGELVWFEGRVAPSRDEKGNTVSLYGSLTDISERKKTEQELRQSATVFENTAEGVLITDARGNIVAANNAFTEITGYDNQEILGANPKVLQSGKHNDEFYDFLWQTIHKTGKWQGEIWNRRKNGEIYPQWLTISAVKDNEGTTTNYVGVFSDITVIKQTQQQLDYLAHHDPLTNLPNRILFNDRLEHAIYHAKRINLQLAVVFIDVDRFKNINDSLGHPIGDQLLVIIADKLAKQVREEDTVARLGGDEFVIVMENITNKEDVAIVVNRLVQTFQQPLTVNGHELHITLSMGVSIFPKDGTDTATLIRNADAAMYCAKEEGRNGFQYYTEELTSFAYERLTIENALRQALNRNQLSLHYQPQISISTGLVTGAEALLRWSHPELGFISPEKFIPVAEESGLILPIGEWVLMEACRQTKMWQQKGLFISRISINLSGLQIQRGNILKRLENVLAQTNLDPRYVELEVTESFIMSKTEEAIEKLYGLKSLGIRIAIDDFGTGYSSLSYLKQLPIDKLKIDRSFVRDITHDADDEAITKAIIALGHSLEMNVIAEGVETKSQEEFLAQHGCTEAQGYLYSRPLPADEFEKYLSSRNES